MCVRDFGCTSDQFPRQAAHAAVGVTSRRASQTGGSLDRALAAQYNAPRDFVHFFTKSLAASIFGPNRIFRGSARRRPCRLLDQQCSPEDADPAGRSVAGMRHHLRLVACLTCPAGPPTMERPFGLCRQVDLSSVHGLQPNCPNGHSGRPSYRLGPQCCEASATPRRCAGVPRSAAPQRRSPPAHAAVRAGGRVAQWVLRR